MKKNNSTLLIAKNDFSGIASAILLKVVLNKDLDISLYKYDCYMTEIQSDLRASKKRYDTIIFFGLKNMNVPVFTDANLHYCHTFEDVKNVYPIAYNEMANKYPNLKVFYEEITAYLDWSWKDKDMYYGRNLDDLSHYHNKSSFIDKIVDRIFNNKELVDNVDREILLFLKKNTSYYINNKKYSIIKKDGKNIAITISETNEIELANKIIEFENVDAVYLINLEKGLLRVKTDNEDIKRKILKKRGRINSNGGTLKINKHTIKKINDLLYNDIIAVL